MNKNNLALAEAYYTAMKENNGAGMEKCLHSHVQFSSPLAQLSGKEAVLEAAKNFAAICENLKIRAKFGSEDQAMLVFDVGFPAPIGKFPTASLINFQEGLISKIELFYDARPLEKKKEEIFS